MDGSIWIYVLLGLALIVIGSLGGLAVVGCRLVRLPADYCCDSSSRDVWIDRHPVIRRTGLILKNLFGAALVALGVLLSLPGVPGPGIRTILIGIRSSGERVVVPGPVVDDFMHAPRVRGDSNAGRPEALSWSSGFFSPSY